MVKTGGSVAVARVQVTAGINLRSVFELGTGM